MQNSHRQLIFRMLKSQQYIFIAIALTSPLILWALCQLLPTFDDWSYYTAPYNGSFFSSRWLPIASWWRPFDHVFGWIVGLNYRLFPTLNHVFVYAAHLLNTYLLWRIAGQLSFSQFGRNIAVLFFYLSPATLGTVTGIDSMNQAYSHLWGLAAMTIYFRGKREDYGEASSARDGEKKGESLAYTIYIACILIATLCKENGYMWAIIIPLVAWGFSLTDRRRLLRDWMLAIVLGVVYFIVRIILTTNQVEINNEYFDVTITNRLKDIATFIGLTWIPVDYVALVYPPERNLFLVGITFIFGMPFILYTYFANPRNIFKKPHIVLFASIFLAALPHLITLFTTMHTYASLSMAALAIAWLCEQLKNKKIIILFFILYIINAVGVDFHHGIEAYKSGLIGKKMGIETKEKTGKPVDSVAVIFIDTDEPKYSSFCVIPYHAFGWGNAVMYETGYQWPNNFEYIEIKINKNAKKEAYRIAKEYIKNNTCQCAWIIEKNKVEVIK